MAEAIRAEGIGGISWRWVAEGFVEVTDGAGLIRIDGQGVDCKGAASVDLQRLAARLEGDGPGNDDHVGSPDFGM